MFKSFTLSYSIKQALLFLTAALWLPLLGWGQTTLINYDFNASITSYPVAPAATAAGIASAITSSEPFASSTTGVVTGTGAFAPNVAGSALVMNNSSGANTRYFQVALTGASLPKYSAFKLYVQGYRPTSGATTLTLQYSLNGAAYQAAGNSFTISTPSTFTEVNFDLTNLTALDAPTSLSFRLLASGASGTGPLRIDNLQVQATNTVDPSITSLSPSLVEAGSADFALAVAGSNFRSGAVVSFANQTLATTYNSPTSLTAAVPAALVAASGSYAVTVATPVMGSVASAAAMLVVTPALPHWKGPAGVGSWFDAANWSTGAVPGATDDVLLDHRFTAGSYTVSFDQSTAVSIKSLTVKPGVGDSIFVLVPATNTAATALTLSNAGAGKVALAIYDRGVVTNASGATSGSGVVVAGSSGATVFIYNGGSYRHASSRGHAEVVNNLGAVPGTEQGIFDFRVPVSHVGAYTLALTGRTYGTLILRNTPGRASTSFTGAGGSLTVQGNLIIGPGVTLSPALSANLSIMGDMRSQGTLQFKNASPPTTTSQLVLAGTKPQTIMGAVTLDQGVGLVINNAAGVTLATPLLLNGPLTLTSGALTTTATNLLTLSVPASLNGTSSTSFINGPLARQTAAGPLTNLVFPTGSGTSYRPVILNATTQDATTYLVTPKEGAAADPTNFLVGTEALPTLARVSRVRSYTITPSSPTHHFNGTVTLSFGPDDKVNQPTDASFTIGKNSGGAGWQNIGRAGDVTVIAPATATAGAAGTITSQPFTSFSDFALASTSADVTRNPLPVTLASFGARRQANGAVEVRWTTASEQRNAYFEVQRSGEATTFTPIARVLAQGAAAHSQTYAYSDGQAPASQLYYRLRQVDADGSVHDSPVVTLAATNPAAPALYPNPSRDQVVVPAPVGTLVQLLDLAGRVLQTVSLPPSGEVKVGELPAGTYLLRLNLSDEQRILHFTKE